MPAPVGPSDLSLDETMASEPPAKKDVALDDTAYSGTITSPRAVVKPDHALGRFTLVDALGQGAMGVVWRAEDPDLGRQVALKLLHRPDDDLMKRLVREARAMAQINHPNVVTIYDVGVASGTTYIAMELVTGTSLRQWLHAADRPQREILELFIAAGRGLAAAHAAGLIHRDFKPDNVLVGTDHRVRVSDFGLANQSDAIENQGVFGTPSYMAPEVFEQGNIDSRTDQFAFCVALYEALYGARPFAGKTFPELAENVCAGRLAPHPSKRAVSNHLRAIILRGLSQRPGDRFPSMDLLLEELGRDRARPWRRAAYAAAAVAVALGIGLVADVAAERRLDAETRQAFLTTGNQIQLAMDLLAGQFRAYSDVAYVAPWITEVSATHDNADFGLGSTTEDTETKVDLHETLKSADLHEWTGMEQDRVEAFTDRSGQLVFTTADPNVASGELAQLPSVARSIAASANKFDMAILPNDTPSLVASHVLGTADPHDVSVLFARAIARGGQIGAVYLQFAAGSVLLQHVSRDQELALALVAPNGRYTPSSFPAALATVDSPAITETTSGGAHYRVRSVPILDQGVPIGRVVMARRFESLLSGLFPHARSVFAAALLAALAIAGFTAIRARGLVG